MKLSPKPIFSSVCHKKFHSSLSKAFSASTESTAQGDSTLLPVSTMCKRRLKLSDAYLCFTKPVWSGWTKVGSRASSWHRRYRRSPRAPSAGGAPPHCQSPLASRENNSKIIIFYAHWRPHLVFSGTGDGFVICEIKRLSKPSGAQNRKRRKEEEKKSQYKGNIMPSLFLCHFVWRRFIWASYVEVTLNNAREGLWAWATLTDCFDVLR